MSSPCTVDTATVILSLNSSGQMEGTVRVSAADGNSVTALSDGIYAPSRPLLVSALPVSPQDGDECYLDAGDPNGNAVWHLRYNATTGDWKYVGGLPLRPPTAGLSANGTIASGATSYQDLATGGVGPSLVLPCAGSFIIHYGFKVSGIAFDVNCTIKLGTAAAADADSVRLAQNDSSGNIDVGQGYRSMERTGLSAGATLIMKYGNNGGATATFANRYLEVLPEAVS